MPPRLRHYHVAAALLLLPGVLLFVYLATILDVEAVATPINFAWLLLVTASLCLFLSVMRGWLLAAVSFGCALLFSAVWLFQIQYYQVYRSFIRVEELSVILQNLEYWWKNETIDIGAFSWALVIVSAAVALCAGLISRYLRPFRWRWILLLLTLAGTGLLAYLPRAQMELQVPDAAMARSLIRFATHEMELIVPRHNRPVRRRAYVERANSGKPPNVLLILNESLRADHLPQYGYHRATLPEFTKWFPNSLVFNAVANSAVTPTAVEAVMTGRSTVHASGGTRTAPMIWDYFKQLGYRTIYAGSHWLQWNGHLDYHTFDGRFVDLNNAPLVPDASGGRNDRETIDLLLHHFERANDEPFFAVVHTRDTHFVYQSDPATDLFFPSEAHHKPERVHTLINLYDNSIVGMDNKLSRIYEALDRIGELDETIVVFASDHGEAFYEHQAFFHTTLFWQEVMQVPLMIHVPPKLSIPAEQLEQLRRNQTILSSNTDILPTLLDLIGARTTDSFHGESLLRPKTKAFELCMSTQKQYAFIETATMRKWIVDNERRKLTQYDLNSDPDEQSGQPIEITKWPQHYPGVLNTLRTLDVITAEAAQSSGL